MTTIHLNDQIVPLEKIVDKNINDVSFREIISLIFYAAISISKNKSNPDQIEWKEIYNNFENELVEQNKQKWPQILISKNDYNKRIDVISAYSPFIETKNIFMLLLRLLYIENYKRPYIFKSYNYHKILGCKMRNKTDIIIKNLSVMDLFGILKQHLNRYMKIYNDENNFEYLLCGAIMKQII